MPTYVYKFIDTDETIEVQQSFSDDTLTEHAHPETGATMPVKKVFLPVGVTFKGDGFYKNDSRSATAKSSNSSRGDSSSSDSPGASDSSSPSTSTSTSTSSDSSTSPASTGSTSSSSSSSSND